MISLKMPADAVPEDVPAQNEEDSGVKGFVSTEISLFSSISYLFCPQKLNFQIDLSSHIDKTGCECLNEADDHPWSHCFGAPGGGYLESDCDEQLILSITFNQVIKAHSIKVKGPKDKGPKTLRVFANLPNTLDFDKAESTTATQDFE